MRPGGVLDEVTAAHEGEPIAGKRTKKRAGSRLPVWDKRALALWVGGGVLMGLPHLHGKLEGLALVSTIPWLLATAGTPRHRFLHSWAGCTTWVFTGLFWIHEVAWPALILASLLWGLAGPFYAFLTGPVATRARLPLWIASPLALIVAEEYARGVVPSLDASFLAQGYAVWRVAPLIQISEIGGVSVVSALMALCAAAILELWRGWRRAGVTGLRERRSWLPAAAAAVVLLGATIFGLARLHALELEPGPRVALVQGNVSQAERLRAGSTVPMVKQHIGLSLGVKGRGVDLVAWPETTASALLEREPVLVGQLQELCRRMGAPLILGAIGDNPDADPPVPSNSAFLIEAERGLTGRQDKRALVPGAETLLVIDAIPPLRDRISEFLSKTMGFRPYLRRGTKSVPLQAGPLRVGVMICYGDMVARLSEQLAANGAEVLLVISNEAWFGSRELDQHLAMSTLRSIETRLPLARSTNNGLTAVIDPGGRVVASLPRDEEGVLVADMPVTKLRALPPSLRLAVRGGVLLFWIGLYLRFRGRSAN